MSMSDAGETAKTQFEEVFGFMPPSDEAFDSVATSMKGKFTGSHPWPLGVEAILNSPRATVLARQYVERVSQQYVEKYGIAPRLAKIMVGVGFVMGAEFSESIRSGNIPADPNDIHTDTN
jgi:hypothetical protein